MNWVLTRTGNCSCYKKIINLNGVPKSGYAINLRLSLQLINASATLEENFCADKRTFTFTFRKIRGFEQIFIVNSISFRISTDIFVHR